MIRVYVYVCLSVAQLISILINFDNYGSTKWRRRIVAESTKIKSSDLSRIFAAEIVRNLAEDG